MSLKFEPRGPELDIQGTIFKFKRVSGSELMTWSAKNNPFKNRPPEERKLLIEKIIAGEIKFEDYTLEEQELSLNQMPMFCMAFINDIDNLDLGGELTFKDLDKEQKFRLFEELYQENAEFSAFVLSYKNGAKKKFTEVA
jgi:hypothetical protein